MRRIVLLAGLSLTAGTLTAQMGAMNASAASAKSYVIYDAEPQVIAAGKRSVLDIRFQVIDGYHVNSHTPKSELLIPTKITLQPATGIKADAPEYPAGTAYSFSFSPKDKLDVYAGAFIIKLPVVAQAGQHEVDATLRYQACDRAACYPPKNLPVQILFTAK